VSGTVSEIGGSPLAAVAVRIASGTGAGLHATTDHSGQYSLFGAAGPVELEASLPGFSRQVQDVTVEADGTNHFILSPVFPAAADISGIWTMTLSPSPGCRSNFPAVAQTRTYAVQFLQQGSIVQVHFSGPTLEVRNPDEDTGTLFGLDLSFVIVGDTGYDTWSVADLIDHISPTEKLEFEGVVHATITNSEIRATMNGDVEYWDDSRAHAPDGSPTVPCRATDHVLMLTRQ
jgi:carboxypeptidase family protein